MADMLKFRKGTLAQINAADKAAGTIYIAKDEKAMYVDIDASTRIRIGDFVRVATVNDIPFPASTTALYYVEADNALLGYDGENWKQINGTKDLADRLTTAENAIATNTSAIGVASKDGAAATGLHLLIENNAAAIADLDAYVGEFTHDTAKTVVEYINAKTEGIATSGNLEALSQRVTTAEGEIDTLQAESSDYESRITVLEGKDVALKSDVTAAKTAVLGQTDGVDFNGTVKGAYEAAATAQTQANKGVADAAAAQSTADANAQSISGLTNRVKALDDATTGEVPLLKSRVQTLENAGYATVTQVNTAKGEVLGTEADAAGTATVHGALKSAAAADAKAVAAANAASAAQGDIDAWETAHANDYTNTQIDSAVADAKKAGTDAQADFDAYETAHASDYTNAQIDAKVKTVQDKVDEHTASLTTLTSTNPTTVGSVAEAKKAGTDALALIGDANSGLTKTVNDHTAALEILNGADSVNGSVANAKKVGTDAATQAETNRQAIATLKGTVDKLDGTVETEGSVKKQIKDAVDAAKTALSAEIDADIRAANAMEYVATIESASGLPATAKNGATYVVGSAFGNYAAGDMLIAQGTEDPATGLITNPTWAHVKSGYDASLDQKLTGANDAIKLSTGTGNAGTEVAFEATGSASVSVANNTVTIGMVWEDFDPQV